MRIVRIVAASLTLAVLFAPSALAQPAPPSTLTGEQLAGSATLTGNCSTTSSSTFSFTASGSATGPYTGTFTETGTYTVSPTPPNGIGSLESFNASFTISSPMGGGSIVTGQPNGSVPILIVDSEESARKLAADALRRDGYSTLEAVSGEEAVEIAQRERPRVVVLEVCLPGICGYEVCRVLREALGESLSIVFLSGDRKESYDRVAGLLLGADDYLVKPFAADELLARVRRLIGRSPPLTSGVASKLTGRERDVLQLLAQGLDQKEIASRLFVSPKTVGTHTEHVFVKLGVHSRSQAVALAYRECLVEAAS